MFTVNKVDTERMSRDIFEQGMNVRNDSTLTALWFTYIWPAIIIFWTRLFISICLHSASHTLSASHETLCRSIKHVSYCTQQWILIQRWKCFKCYLRQSLEQILFRHVLKYSLITRYVSLQTRTMHQVQPLQALYICHNIFESQGICLFKLLSILSLPE
jgi:hypothetical protein